MKAAGALLIISSVMLGFSACSAEHDDLFSAGNGRELDAPPGMDDPPPAANDSATQPETRLPPSAPPLEPGPPMDPAPSDPGPGDVGSPPPPDEMPTRDAGVSTPSRDAATPSPAICDDPALVLCLRFEGNLEDESPSAHAVNGESLDFTPGPSGRAVRLSEETWLGIPESATLDLDEFTLELWVNAEEMPGPGQRAGLLDNDGQYGLFLLPGGDVICTTGGATVRGDAMLTIDQWTSLACSYGPAEDGNNELALWSDGHKVTGNGGAPPSHAGNAGLAIGRNNPAGEAFHGLLDNLRIWTVRRSGAQLCDTALSCERDSID